MASPGLTELATTTLRNRTRTIADNVSNNNALTRRLQERGRVRPASGGRTIVQELDYQEGNFQYYSGYETFSIAPADVITAAEFSWKQGVATVTISGLEGEVQNTGPEAAIGLLESRIENAERTLMNKVSEGIYSDGTGSGGRQIGGLQLLVADDPSSGTVGGIDRASYAFWRNVEYDVATDLGAAASASNIKGYMQTLYTQLIRGADRPDIAVADANYWQYYWESLTDIQRIERVDQGESGFRELKFAGADVVYDGGSGIPTNHMYMLNTSYLFLRPHTTRWMVPLDKRNAINQDAMVVPIVFAGNLTMSNASLQGVIWE